MKTKLKSKKYIFIAVTIFLVLIFGIGMRIIFLTEDKKDEKILEKVEEQKLIQFEKEDPNLAKELGSQEPLNDVGPLYPLDKFTINLLGEKSDNLLQVVISLELSRQGLKKELDSKSAVIRDIIIKILTSKTLEEVSTDIGKEKLSQEILNQINYILSDGTIKHVYFQNFIIS